MIAGAGVIAHQVGHEDVRVGHKDLASVKAVPEVTRGELAGFPALDQPADGGVGQEASQLQLGEYRERLAAGNGRVEGRVETSGTRQSQGAVVAGPDKVVQEAVGPNDRLIVVNPAIEAGSLVAHVAHIQGRLPRQLALDAEGPLLNVGGSQAGLQGEARRRWVHGQLVAKFARNFKHRRGDGRESASDGLRQADDLRGGAQSRVADDRVIGRAN